jgi:hypothetical protein
MTTELRLRRLVLELRRKLADAELAAAYRRLEADRQQKKRPRLVKTLPSVKIRMDGTKNHGRPHVHCDIGSMRHVASIAIDNARVIAGALPNLQKREAQTWIKHHKRALTKLWHEMQAGRPVTALICELQEAKGYR